MTDETTTVLCRSCGVTIHERPSKSRGTVWTRTGPGGPMVICEHSPDHWHHPHQDDPEHGHTFRIEVTSRGSCAVDGIEGHTDADHFGPPMSIEVRAWNLPDALRTAAALFPSVWNVDE